jgi:hypothetical protein
LKDIHDWLNKLIWNSSKISLHKLS